MTTTMLTREQAEAQLVMRATLLALSGERVDLVREASLFCFALDAFEERMNASLQGLLKAAIGDFYTVALPDRYLRFSFARREFQLSEPYAAWVKQSVTLAPLVSEEFHKAPKTALLLVQAYRGDPVRALEALEAIDRVT